MINPDQVVDVPVGTGDQITRTPYNFGVPSGGAREHPLEMSTTGIYPNIPVRILNDTISVKEFDPSFVGQQG